VVLESAYDCLFCPLQFLDDFSCLQLTAIVWHSWEADQTFFYDCFAMLCPGACMRHNTLGSFQLTAVSSGIEVLLGMHQGAPSCLKLVGS
jgi:hypothetical protein